LKEMIDPRNYHLAGTHFKEKPGRHGEETSKADDRTRPVSEDYFSLLEREFPNSVCNLIVSSGQTNLILNPELGLFTFRNVITRLWEIDQVDGGKRILIWVLDLGKQVFGDPDSHRRYMNVQTLLARFKALKRFREGVTDEELSSIFGDGLIGQAAAVVG
jgi:hypothetical protein